MNGNTSLVHSDRYSLRISYPGTTDQKGKATWENFQTAARESEILTESVFNEIDYEVESDVGQSN